MCRWQMPKWLTANQTNNILQLSNTTRFAREMHWSVYTTWLHSNSDKTAYYDIVLSVVIVDAWLGNHNSYY